MKTFKTVRNPSNSRISKVSRIFALILALCFCLPILQTDNPYVNAYEDAIASGEAAPWDIHSYRGRNSLLSAYDLIPAGWLATFQSLEYDVHFRLPTSRTPKIPGHTAAGVTNYAEKFIAVENCNPRATLHEFAHFAAKYAGLYVDDMERCYEHESSKVIAIIGIYSSLDFSEYLAEFASYWLLHPNDQSILRELAPETTALTEYLFHVLDYNIPVKTTA